MGPFKGKWRSYLFLSEFVHVCMWCSCMYVCVWCLCVWCLCACVCVVFMCVCVCRGKLPSNTLCSYSFENFSLNLELVAFWLDGPDSKMSLPMCSPHIHTCAWTRIHTVSALTGMNSHTEVFMWVLGIWTQELDACALRRHFAHWMTSLSHSFLFLK